MQKVILDCDNTMGVIGCDVDDGMAFLYLCGCPEIDMLGITTSYANSGVEVVYRNTVKMLADLHMTERVPLHKGCRGNGAYDAPAVDFLVEQVNRFPGEIALLVTGATSNVYGAYLKDPAFFEKLRCVLFMGGITEPFYLNGVLCKEINFSADPRATASIFRYGKNLAILSAQTTQHAYFGPDELARIDALNTPLTRYLMPILRTWVSVIETKFGTPGFCNWDLCTAMYLTNPEVFTPGRFRVIPSEENFRDGFMQVDAEGNCAEASEVEIPVGIADLAKLNDLFIAALERIAIG